ncbi:MAG: response regulator [Acidithiobacillales bacterium]
MAARCVLIVDDDPDTVAYVSSLLEDQDYWTRSASDAAQALRALDGFRPDAILVDVLMPGRSGLDLVVTLRSDPRYRNIPLVVVTGMDQILEHDCQSYLMSLRGVSGPDAVLGKPIDPKALLAVLAYVCGGLPVTA